MFVWPVGLPKFSVWNSEGYFRLGCLVGFLFFFLFVPWHDKCLTGEYKWEINISAKPMEARTVLCQNRKESLGLPLGMNLLSVAYISTIIYVAWKDLSYLGFFIFLIDFAVKASVWSNFLYLYWWISKTSKNLEFSSIQKGLNLSL